MSLLSRDASELLRLEELIRQERETFDQRKSQDTKWFNLRLRMGYTAALLLPCIAFVAGYVLLNASDFSASVTNIAGGTLLVDVLGIVGSVWKVVLNPGSVTKLAPTVSKTTLNEIAD